GNIVLLKAGPDNKAFLKRVVGMPGEVIQISNGAIYINGEKFEENYVLDGIQTAEPDNGYEITLSDDEYFLMSGNRLYGIDSRDFGAVKKNKRIYKVLGQSKDGE
ncbi:MAG: signal peptidase I, partial [Peptostreptococcaceae bacterium]